MPDIMLPTVGVTPGPQYATQINTAISTVNDVLDNGRLSPTSVSNTIAARTSSYSVPLPASTSGDHTAHILEHMAIAQAGKFTSVVIPYLNPSDPSVRWNIANYITLWSGVTLFVAPILATNITKPIVLIPPTCSEAEVHFADALGTRVTNYSEYATTGSQFGISIRGSHAAVMVFGNRNKVRGYVHGFRTGALAGNWTGTGQTNSGRPFGNDIEVTADTVDFGVMYYAQRNGRFVARGQYIRTPGSPDEPHIMYGTQATTSSDDCYSYYEAWDTPEGCPGIFKANKNLTVSMNCRNTAGLIEITNEYGPTTISSMIGYDIRSEAVNKLHGVLYGGTSQPWSEPTYPKTVENATVHLNDEAATNPTRIRVGTLNGGGWKIKNLDISYKYDSTIDTASLVSVLGDNVDIDNLSITNRGTGGVVGVYVRPLEGGAGSRGFLLRKPPKLDGVSVGVLVDPVTENLTLNVDKSLIRALTRDLDVPRKSSYSIRNAPVSANMRSNRYYAYPAAAAISTVTLAVGNEYAFPVIITEPVTVTSMGIRISTAAAGGSVLLGIRNDFGNGVPGSLVAGAPAIAADATGDLESAFATPSTLAPGVYWLVACAQTVNVVVRGSIAGTAITSAASLSTAMSGGLPYQGGVSGSLSTNFTETGQSTAGCARIALKLA